MCIAADLLGTHNDDYVSLAALLWQDMARLEQLYMKPHSQYSVFVVVVEIVADSDKDREKCHYHY